MDFTTNTYRFLLEELKTNCFIFLPFKEYIQSRHGGQAYNESQQSETKTDLPRRNEVKTDQPVIILRHDVDDLVQNSLRFAKIQNEIGIRGTYYFRVVPQSYDEQVIKEIAELGHEIGYHYEDVDLVLKGRNNGITEKWNIVNKFMKEKDNYFKGDVNIPQFQNSNIPNEQLIDAAYESFSKNLEMFRKNFDVNTVCMHGSPRSKYDNKIIWEKYDYRELGIIGEPYFDLDFNEFAYFTDTGRRWNGNNVSVRDKVNSKYNFNFKSTMDIIHNIDKLPNKIMFTIHPERWNDRPIPWIKEFFLQNLKNTVKRVIVNKAG